MSGNLGISANEDTIESVLSRNYRYTVPDYQRQYSWGEEQWRALWEDLQSLEDGQTHFLGSIVVIERSAGLNELDRLEVVDGQQRLATILTMLSVMRQKYLDEGESAQADAIRDEYLFEQDLDQREYQNLSLSKYDNDSFSSILDCDFGQVDKENLTEALEFYGSRIHSLSVDETDTLRKKLLSSVTLVTIECTEEQSAFRLFETLNERGLELSSVDLMKNHVFSIAAQDDEVDYEAVRQSWQTTIDNTVPNLNKPSRFFRHYIMSAPEPDFSDAVSDYKLYDIFQDIIEEVRSSPDITLESYLTDVTEQSELYMRIVNADINRFDRSGNEAINEKLTHLHYVKSVQARTLLLRIFREFDNPNKVMEALGVLERFLVRWKVANYATGSQLDRIYSELCSTVFDGSEPVEQMADYLREKYPSDAEFKAGIENKRVKLNNRTKYMLKRIEEVHYNGNIDRMDDYELEHIAPRSAYTATKHSAWVTTLDTTQATFEQHRDRLGNLTLLETDKNIRASNNPFETKKSEYATSDVVMTQRLADDYNDWNLDSIQERTSELADIAANTWSL
ncbi:Uncharacterized conserved protein, contains ParB-like and HNH nuclease domains [Halobiforma haloterrestris]|uniref:Uncharacterized conserved protein, contains ParB-like and HNH nuclease domains n=1 Tax=Natronobacterium haloterrestre TaxID=148448 RepID=A0A1I1IX20_NATHA|nr:DUF262 domain-containing protein [Halobiforma haloterrestris]SFC37770.1 Uncharacterized conserved protein, contains ParB-like and HNH nuclease domains [Halobiforma haloterrestris]